MARVFTSILLTLVALLAAGGAATGQSGWQTVSSPQGRFQVQMPEQPKLKVTSRSTIVGTIETNTWSTPPGGAGGEYEVVYQDLPGIALFFKGRRSIMKRAQQEYLKAIKATEVASEEIKMGKNLGRQLTFRTGDGRTGEALILMVGKRLYVVHQYGAPPQDARRFFSSFEITPAGSTATH